MDLWAAIIAGFKAASSGMVTVLGSVGAGTAISEYDGLDVDGIYLVGTAGAECMWCNPSTPFSDPVYLGTGPGHEFAEMSADGSIVVAAGNYGELDVWDVATIRPLSAPE